MRPSTFTNQHANESIKYLRETMNLLKQNSTLFDNNADNMNYQVVKPEDKAYSNQFVSEWFFENPVSKETNAEQKE